MGTSTSALNIVPIQSTVKLADIRITETTLGSISQKNGATLSGKYPSQSRGDIVFYFRCPGGWIFVEPKNVRLTMHGGLSFRPLHEGKYGDGIVTNISATDRNSYYTVELPAGSSIDDDRLIIIIKNGSYNTSMSSQKAGQILVSGIGMAMVEIRQDAQLAIMICGDAGTRALTDEAVHVADRV